MSDHNDSTMAEQPLVPESTLPISPNEQRALDLYDQIQELRLEIAIIKAQQSLQRKQNPRNHAYEAMDEDITPEEADSARNELLEARAKYQLRNQVIERVLSADPILKAVHDGTEASPAERDLLPFIKTRDATALSVAAAVKTMDELRSQGTDVETSTLGITGENVALAREVMDLVSRVDEKKKGYLDDAQMVERIRKLEDDMKGSRRRWRIMKGITSGVVAGSGVDWARDEVLCDLVLDPEDE